MSPLPGQDYRTLEGGDIWRIRKFSSNRRVRPEASAENK